MALKSRTFFRFGILLTLAKIAEFIRREEEKADLAWIATNAAQEAVAQVLNGSQQLLVLPGTVAAAGYDVGKLNDLLASHGFANFQIPQLSPGDVAGVTIFKAVVTWKDPGEIEYIRTRRGANVPGVKISEAEIFSTTEGEVFKLPLKEDGWEVYLLPFYGEQPSSLGLLSIANQRLESLQGMQPKQSACAFPMAHLESQPDLTVFEGMGLTDGSTLAVMKQLNRLAIDPVGARVESATFAGATRSLEQTPTIRGPYLFVLRHIEQTLFVALVGEEAFLDPNKSTAHEVIENDAPQVQQLDEPVHVPAGTPVVHIAPATGHGQQEGIVTFV